MKSLNVTDEVEGARALNDGTSGESRGAGDPGEASVSNAGRALSGIAAAAQLELPAVTAELFVVAGEAPARLAAMSLSGAEQVPRLLQDAAAQAAVARLDRGRR